MGVIRSYEDRVKNPNGKIIDLTLLANNAFDRELVVARYGVDVNFRNQLVGTLKNDLAFRRSFFEIMNTFPQFQELENTFKK